ncbi:MAG: integrase core domain-containing protein [Gemmatimonadetes bacterium]|nr:integrase core domain-containing protein [Gemmatimonadota bacterium]MDA1104383.1 integrase core domain-containing protein [Gemmatimonadota bacterium]
MRLPPRSANLNAYAERFVLSIKSECLDRMVLMGERHLRCAVGSYVEHYHLERPHQGLGIQPIEGVPKPSEGAVLAGRDPKPLLPRGSLRPRSNFGTGRGRSTEFQLPDLPDEASSKR